MKKFDQWNSLKKKVEANRQIPYFHSREVWFLRLGENIGFEQDGKGEEFLRPTLIYKKFSRNVFLGIPLTSQKKESKFHASFLLKNKKSTAILSQIRLFDAKRLRYYHGRISNKEFSVIKEKLIELLQ